MKRVSFKAEIAHGDKPTVLKALKAVSGVSRVWVTIPPTPAIVTVSCKKTTEKATLEQAVRNAGFEIAA